MAARLIVDANSAFIDEDFETAVELYSQAIDTEPSSDAYSSRAAVHLKMENWTEAVADATMAIKMQSSNSKAHLRKGVACFNLGEFVSAKKAFSDGLALENLTDKKIFQTWLRKCDAELEDAAPAARIPVPPAAAPAPAPARAPASAAVQASAAVLAPPQTPSARFRHDWIQSPSHVTVNVYIKGSSGDNCRVDLDERELTLERVLSKDDSWQMHLELWAAIVPGESKVEYGSAKVELKLKKAVAGKWDHLEAQAVSVADIDDQEAIRRRDLYPSSQGAKNWGDIEKSIEDDKPEGDEALNKFFKEIYGKSSEDTRRAMNKSFVESGGTVLSTNWSEIGKGKVEGKAPDGLEMKQWSEAYK